MSYCISASILSANLAYLAAEVEAVVQAGADRIHFDVMDQHYVPNLTFGPVVLNALRQAGVQVPIDVHLMTYHVTELATAFAKAGATSISFHPEAVTHLDRSVRFIKDLGVAVGLTLNPTTSLSCLEYILPELDRVLLMSVNPGFAGQTFIPYVLDKALALRQRIDSLNQPIILEMDGGIHTDNIAKVARHGVTSFVAGSAIFHSENYAHTIQAMRQAVDAALS